MTDQISTNEYCQAKLRSISTLGDGQRTHKNITSTTFQDGFMDFTMQNKPNQKMKCRTKNLSPWMKLSLGLLLLSLFTRFVVAAQDATIAPSPAIATNQNYWAVEDAKAREKLPLYLTIPAAKPEELTPANGYPKRKTFLTWQRSHGDNSGARYSALDQINRQNVTHLQVAWIYHSKDGSNAIQCNPIIV